MAKKRKPFWHSDLYNPSMIRIPRFVPFWRERRKSRPNKRINKAHYLFVQEIWIGKKQSLFKFRFIRFPPTQLSSTQLDPPTCVVGGERLSNLRDKQSQFFLIAVGHSIGQLVTRSLIQVWLDQFRYHAIIELISHNFNCNRSSPLAVQESNMSRWVVSRPKAYT